MNNFCRSLKLSLSGRFSFDVNVYDSKRKETSHVPNQTFFR